MFVPVLRGDGTKIAPTGDIFDQTPGGMISIRGKLADHVGDHVVISPEGAVLVTSPGTESSYPRPPQSLNNSTALSLPPHMQHLAPFWAKISGDLQFKMARIPFTTVKAGLREAEKTADRRATELADEEHHYRRQGLAAIVDGLDASIAELEASAAAKIAEARALMPRACSTHAATATEDMAHAKQAGRFNSGPRASIFTRMDPPPSR